jgi:hypothetical protein
MQLTKRIRFERWQGKKVHSERHFMDTALLIEVYLKKINRLQIKNDTNGIRTRSGQYEAIYNAYRPLRCVLLYCTLEVEEALDLLSESLELAALKALKSDFAALYDNYTDKPAERLVRIQLNLNAFLQIKWDAFSNKEKAKELYYTLYFALCSANQSLDNLLPGAGFLAGFYKIDIKKHHKKIKELMKLFEDTIMIFEQHESAKDKSIVRDDQYTSHRSASCQKDTIDLKTVNTTIRKHRSLLLLICLKQKTKSLKISKSQ